MWKVVIYYTNFLPLRPEVHKHTHQVWITCCALLWCVYINVDSIFNGVIEATGALTDTPSPRPTFFSSPSSSFTHSLFTFYWNMRRKWKWQRALWLAVCTCSSRKNNRATRLPTTERMTKIKQKCDNLMVLSLLTYKFCTICRCHRGTVNYVLLLICYFHSAWLL